MLSSFTHKIRYKGQQHLAHWKERSTAAAWGWQAHTQKAMKQQQKIAKQNVYK